MSTFLGMDPDQIEAVGRNLNNQSDQLRSVISAVDHLIHQVEGAWKGNDATQFIDSWRSHYKSPMMQAVQQLHDLGMAANKNAADQRNVSGH